MNDQLRNAMNAADLAEIEAIAQSIGAEAVQTALAVRAPDPREEEVRAKAEAEAQRQRDQAAAVADVVNAVDAHRKRLGRKTCTAHDGATILKMVELLRAMTPGMDE